MFCNTVMYDGKLIAPMICMVVSPSCYIFSRRLYSLDSTKPCGHSCWPSAWSSEKNCFMRRLDCILSVANVMCATSSIKRAFSIQSLVLTTVALPLCFNKQTRTMGVVLHHAAFRTCIWLSSVLDTAGMPYPARLSNKPLPTACWWSSPFQSQCP